LGLLKVRQKIHAERSMQNRNRHQAQTTTQGFTLTESVVAVAIIGSLAAIATPKYFGQIQANCQRQSESSYHDY